MWGVGFVIVDMRVKKLLKRLVATPMKRTDFLWSVIGSRLVFTIPELVVILDRGCCFSASQCRETLSPSCCFAWSGPFHFRGWDCWSPAEPAHRNRVGPHEPHHAAHVAPLGIFFSSDRFPDSLQPLVQALPLTQLNNALRGGHPGRSPLTSQFWRLLILAAWGGIPFVLALRWFRWN